MPTVAIIYGSSTGRTEEAADNIRKCLEVGDVYSIADTDLTTLLRYDIWILGTSTWGTGELQDDWAEQKKAIPSLNLTGKILAFFGLGDQESFPDTFVDGLGILYESFASCGAKILGSWPTDGYFFETSRALKSNKFVGLALDDDTQGAMTDDRIVRWVKTLKVETGL